MNRDEIKEIIKNGENSYIEFKEEGIKAKDLAEEIVALANSEGGIILIGVDDDGDIKGVSDKQIEEKIMNICRNNCIPNIIPAFEIIDIAEKTIAVITISKGLNKPYYTSEHKYYIRVGTTKRIASREELLRLFEANGALHFDISPIEDTSIKDLNLDVVRDYFLNIILLICWKRIEMLFREFAHFRGNEITDELIDKKVVTGRIQDIAEQILVVFKNNMRTQSSIEGLKREEKTEYPILVLREAIVNTLVHRNYSISGSKIRILMFEDRIEFHSPGRLPNTVLQLLPDVQKLTVLIA